jgi:hypothetical protein
MQSNEQRSARKKRQLSDPSGPSNNKELKKLERLRRNLSRYVDYDVQKFLWADAKSLEGLPQLFHVAAESGACCAVRVNWETVRVALVATARELCEHRLRRRLTEEEVARVTKRITTKNLLHVVEFLPTSFDSALMRLCFEALIASLNEGAVKLPDDEQDECSKALIARLKTSTRQPGLAGVVDMILRPEEESIKSRLEIRRGPRPRFRNMNEYEMVLRDAMNQILSEGQRITYGNVAGKIDKDRADAIDERVIRRWNTEFDINWKAKKKAAIKNRTRSLINLTFPTLLLWSCRKSPTPG